MRISGGRFVRIFQWIAPVLLVLLIVFGRGLFGAPLGWMAAIGLFVGPLVTIAMYIAPIIVIFDRDGKATRSTRVLYDVASWVTWAAMLLMMFTLEDGGDSGPVGSVVSTWGWMSSDAASTIFGIAMIVAILGWLAAIATAIAGVVSSRRA
ncbi:hypothetical protein ACTU6U_07360 [Microbacterium sp. A196]|uniref:hypothetical protein n=1 Tax=unclassified Microbacterium TaxID=2609290 RepID=UPI003FD05F51